jgi:glycosyltransferase involved in cell wall biosynthesis
MAPCADPGDYGIPVGSRLIVFAGRYSEEKNIIVLLEAVTRVIRGRSDVAALFFGEGPLRGEIEQQVSESGLGARVKVHGYCESLWAVMKAADVFVSVSMFEGHPNTVLEAIAARCPLVVSDIPEHREFLDETSAYLARPSSIADVADTVVSALDNRTEARAKADAAFRTAAKWSVESQTIEYMNLYRDILGDELHIRYQRHGS